MNKGSQKATVCVIGLGYIGLPTACILADAGFNVIGVDVRPEVVEKTNAGDVHIEEPDLDLVLRRAIRSGRLKASTSPQPADIFMICVPTPHHADHSPDLTYVEQASKNIRPFVQAGNLIVLESTSPPKTTDEVVCKYAIPDHLEVGYDVYVAHCPERVLPGRILFEAVHNDRVVGGMTPACTDVAVKFYEQFVKGKVLGTNALAAEVTKLVENSFRDVNIAFANELSMLCGSLGVDVWEVIELANRHPRVKILNPGPGVGGHCISVDPWFLVHTAPELTPLIRTARTVNDSKPHFVINQVAQAASQLDRPVIGCLGLTYKADVDDIRESPAIDIVRALNKSGVGEVLACDPHVDPVRCPDLKMVDIDEVVQRANILVLLTDHMEFREISFESIRHCTLVDTRAFWRNQMRGVGQEVLPLRRAA